MLVLVLSLDLAECPSTSQTNAQRPLPELGEATHQA